MPSRLLAKFGAPSRGSTVRGTITPGEEHVEINKVAVIGGGTMGSGIAEVCAKAGLDTIVDSICFSACPYVFAAGADRSAGPNARIGVHQHYFGESTILPAFLAVEDVQRGQADVMNYLDDMGVDVRVMGLALSTPPDEIYILLPEELAEYRLVTDG